MPHCARDAPLCDATCQQPQVMPQATGARTPAAAAGSLPVVRRMLSSDHGRQLLIRLGMRSPRRGRPRRCPPSRAAPSPGCAASSDRACRAPARESLRATAAGALARRWRPGRRSTSRSLANPIAHITASYWPEVPSLDPRPQCDAVEAGESPGAGSDDLVAAGQPSSQPRLRGHSVQAQALGPPPDVAVPAAVGARRGCVCRPRGPRFGTRTARGRSGTRVEVRGAVGGE